MGGSSTVTGSTMFQIRITKNSPIYDLRAGRTKNPPFHLPPSRAEGHRTLSSFSPFFFRTPFSFDGHQLRTNDPPIYDLRAGRTKNPPFHLLPSRAEGHRTLSSFSPFFYFRTQFSTNGHQRLSAIVKSKYSSRSSI